MKIAAFPLRSAARLLTLAVLLAGAASVAPVAHAATFTVTNSVDDTSSGSLRNAIALLNASTDSVNTIDFAFANGKIVLGSALPDISRPVTINAGVGNTLDGASLYRAFTVNVASQSTAVAINNLTIQNVRAVGGDGIGNGGGGMGAGAGIYVTQGSLTLTGVNFVGSLVVQGGKGGNGGNTGGAGGSGAMKTRLFLSVRLAPMPCSATAGFSTAA